MLQLTKMDAIQTIFIALFVFAVIILLYLIIKPMVELALLKLKHGSEIDIQFMPILGERFYQERDRLKHKDSLHYRRTILKVKPGVKVLASNLFLDKIHIQFVDCHLIKQILQAPEKYRKYDTVLFHDLLMNKELSFTEDQIWKDQRKTISHQFTYQNLKTRIPIIKSITKQVFQKQIKFNQDIKLFSVASEITGEVIIQTFFGKEFSNQLINGLSLKDAVADCISVIGDLTVNRLWTHLRGFIYGYKSNIPKCLLTNEEKTFLLRLEIMKKFIHDGITRREQNFDLYEQENNTDFIQIYLSDAKKNGRGICYEELIQQLINLTYAGTDLTGVFMSMAIYMLSLNPDLQEYLRSHVREHIKSFDDLTQENLSKLENISAFCQEVLRQYSPATRLFFRMCKEQHNIGKFTMKPHYLISGGILSVHSDPQYYDKPEEFRINRWLNLENREPYAFIPFSGGPKNCIGQHMAMVEAKISLIYVLMNYRLVPDPKQELVMERQSLYQPQDDRLVHFQQLLQ